MRIATAYASRMGMIVLALAVTVSAIPSGAFGAPNTPEIEAKQEQAISAQAELERMNIELEVRVEEYNAITESLDQTREDILATEAELERARDNLDAAQDTLSRRATSIYKGGSTDALEVFLGARSFTDFLTLLDLAVRISNADAEMVAEVQDAKSRVEATALALQQRQAEQIALQSEAEARARRIQADMEAQQRFVGQLNGEVRALIAAEEERLRKLAEERARQAAIAAAARGKVSGDRAAADPSALGAGTSQVVAIALQYLGVPYVWGGSSPSGFDCSGLTQYSYRQVGVSLPRTSQSQYNAGQHIARDRLDLLKPGDLVFFGTNGDADEVHHVGMYVGDGNYVHAPYTGAVVRVDSLNARISSRADYVGASRF